MSRARITCKSANFEKALTDILDSYGKDVGKKSELLVKTVGERTRQAVESNITTAGIGGTVYRHSIRVKYAKTSGFRLFSTATIHSPKHYRLTHLLENGHRIVIKGKDTGDETKARPHWKQAEEAAIREMETGINEVIK